MIGVAIFMEQYMKTKAFSELTGVSVRTLQYYDELGVLKPAYHNEYGHRFYDANSFSKIFVILFLKNLGMSLQEIKQYIDGKNFDLRVFLRKEKRRLSKTITDLQIQLIHLSNFYKQLEDNDQIMDSVLFLFSQTTNGEIDFKLQRKQIERDKKIFFNMREWAAFVKDLNFCYQKQLPIHDELVIKCIQFWQTHVLEVDYMIGKRIKKVEDFYGKFPADAFGITREAYHYLMRSIKNRDNKIEI